MDSFYRGSKKNVAHLTNNLAFELLRRDVTFSLCVEVAKIYNLSCPASPTHHQYNPVLRLRQAFMELSMCLVWLSEHMLEFSRH